MADNLDEAASRRAEHSVLPGGAALHDPDTATAFVLIDDGEVGRFGPSLGWADRVGAERLEVLVDGSPVAPGMVARRAGAFRSPTPRVWSVAGRAIAPAVVSDPVEDTTEPDPDLVALIEGQGLEAVWEHGVLRAEWLGLEVARTVGDHLEVGVGRHDRYARGEMRPGEDPASALAEARQVVADRRRAGAAPHPANRLARSRWLRSLAVADPGRYGLEVSQLRAVPPPLPWFDLPEAGPAPAVGIGPLGRPVVMVFCVGADLDLVPTGVDSRLLHAPEGAELVLVLPEADDLPVTRRLAGRLVEPADLVTITNNWM